MLYTINIYLLTFFFQCHFKGIFNFAANLKYCTIVHTMQYLVHRAHWWE